MLQVDDIMTRGVFTLEAEASAEEAAWALTRRGFGGAPVADRDGNIIGMLTKSDLVNPGTHDWIIGEATASDIMSARIFCCYAGDPALAAAQLMTQKKIHRLLVLDSDGKPAGIISTMDIVKAVADGKRFDDTD